MPILVLARFGPKLASLAPFALAINLAAAGAGSAQSAPDVVCRCQCDAGPGGVKEAIYPPAAACGVHEGQTCKFEGPDRAARTGTVRACSTEHRPGDAAGPLGPHSAGVLIQPDRPRSVRPNPPPEPAPR